MPNVSRRRRRRLAEGIGDEYVVQWGDVQDLRNKVYPVNDKYLDFFEADMDEAGIPEAQLQKYLANADLYLNQFLLEKENLQMPDGPAEFFGFMTRTYTKIPTETVDPANVKAMCIGIQKFYESMLKHDRILLTDYQELCRIIAANQMEWMASSTKLGHTAVP